MDAKLLNQLTRTMEANPADYMVSFRENLRKYIDHKEISLSDIAEEAGLSSETLKSLVYGDSKDCKLSTVVALARALHISVDELVGCGTISPVMCESIAITRNLPSNFVHFVRWAIRYHERCIHEAKVSKKAVNIMIAEETGEHNITINNNFELMDISDLSDMIRPKIFMGIRIPNDNYMPLVSEGSVLLLANDRKPLPSENVVVISGGFLWIVKREEEKTPNGTKVYYRSPRDSRYRYDADEIEDILGYVAKIINPEK